MSTFLETVNDIQVRLRETETAAVNTSDYSKLIGVFVNDTKREVEDAWDWIALRSLVIVTTAASTSGYDLTGTNRRTRIRQDNNGLDMVWNTSDQYRMSRRSLDYINNEQQVTNQTNAPPTYFAVSGFSSAGLITVELSSTPSSIQTLKFDCIIPQDTLVAGTDEATEITLEPNVIKLGAWAKAIHERGEDGGALFNEVSGQYKQALADAISYDRARSEQETRWTVV